MRHRLKDLRCPCRYCVLRRRYKIGKMPPQQPPVPAISKVDGIRFFSDATLQASVDKALANVTSNSAVLQLEANSTGWNAAVAAKLGEHWSIAAAYTHDSWGSGAATRVKFEW